MVRISKQSERRSRSPRKHRGPTVKTGTRKDNLPFKEHNNAIEGELAGTAFIPKIK
ncbi:MAG: hypothetical protein H0X51_09960 [Parachlamydiaceae bacterium]|nr:hypothetical protein [Parachlamydiaceae bacterium]